MATATDSKTADAAAPSIKVGDLVRSAKGKVPGEVLKLVDGMATIQWKPKLINRTASGSKTTEPVARMVKWEKPTA